MTTHETRSGEFIVLPGTATMDIRTSLTGQFLVGAAMQARAATEIESRLIAASDNDQVMYRSLVIGAIMQATAALECEVWEVMVYGPGHHLGSNRIDTEARDLLKPIAEKIDRKPVLNRYQSVLHRLQKPFLNNGKQPWQDTFLVVWLRNELVHYKSRWGRDLDRRDLDRRDLDRSERLQALQRKRHPKPAFIPEDTNFFPHRCLSAACAVWSARSCFLFLDAFSERLGFPTRLDPYRAHFVNHSPVPG